MPPTPLQDEVDVKVRAFVAEAAEIESKYVIPGNDNHPSPTVSYATVLNITKRGRGIDAEVARPGPGATEYTLNHSGVRHVIYSVQFYGSGAEDYIESLLSFPATTPGQIWLAENNLTWIIAGDIVNLDTVINSKFEIRRSVDITLSYQSTRQVVTNKLGSVEIDFNYSAETDINETLEVTDA